MLWKKFKNLDYQVKLYVFYGLSVLGIIYHIYDIFTITTLLSNTQFYTQYAVNDVFNSYIDKTLTLDYNLTIGGAIRQVAIDLIQIIFFSMFMLILYIHEVNNGRTE